MKSKRSHEGYLLIDHRMNPGIGEDLTQAAGLPVGAGRGVFEAPTYTCSHCCAVVIINPLRNRERAYCRKCDHYICDRCGAVAAQTQECRTFNQLAEEIQEAAARQPDTQRILLP